MKLLKSTAVAMGLIGAAMGTMLAADDARGRERALERLQLASSEHVRILTELQSSLPEHSKADMTKAIQAATKGMQAAREALNAERASVAAHPEASMEKDAPDEMEPPDAEDDGPGDMEHPNGDHVPPETHGVEHAREQVAAAFDRSMARLQEVMVETPEKADKIQATIDRLEANHARTLANLDRVIAMHLEKPERPEHASRPERPERPERAERPEKPERPEHPRP